jgi:predicted RNA-binding protein with PUA-like domain
VKEVVMARWLLKTEPDCYAWDQLVKDKKTTWDGVANATALKHIRAMKKGDVALIYHTGDERAAVGVAEITSNPYPDPKEGDDKLVVVDLKPKKKLPTPVTLSDIKADPAFAGWDFLRIGRLSVVPVPDPMWSRIEELSKSTD